jgi:hypothetical protein
MQAEIDLSIDDGRGYLTLVEGKALADYTLSRNEAFIFASKVRDHEASRSWRWNPAFALVASAGRVSAIFARWCFYEGIDVLDPDRFPLTVLVRVPALFSASVFDALPEAHLYDWLLELLQIEDHERLNGPVLLRQPTRRKLLSGNLLHDLNEIQAKLSENLWKALCATMSRALPEEQTAELLAELERALRQRGIHVPFRSR